MLALFQGLALSGQEWRYAGHGERTQWSENIKYPERVSWEYPRPQMLRSRWMSLNGIWNYVVTPRDRDSMPASERKIFVPFPLEAPLSGAGRTILERDALWYTRTFEVPAEWKGSRLLLHFGAVDRECEVLVNGRLAGTHSGGDEEFVMDITSLVTKKGEQRLTLKVRDGIANGPYPISGIWQTVWMEPVNAKAHIDRCVDWPDIDRGVLYVTPQCSGAKKDDILHLYLFDDDNIIADVTFSPGETIEIKIDNPKFWSPSNPHLYDYTVNLLRGKKLLDIVRCYTALRKMDVVEVPSGAKYLSLNGTPFLACGVKDDSWWPDGLCTPPSDAALRNDLLQVRTFGFNAVLRSGASPARWKYWCDVLGLVAISEVPEGVKVEDLPFRPYFNYSSVESATTAFTKALETVNGDCGVLVCTNVVERKGFVSGLMTSDRKAETLDRRGVIAAIQALLQRVGDRCSR